MERYFEKVRNLHRREELSSYAHHNGPCLPGVKRLFVRTDGTLFPCERVSEILDYYVIGTLEDGFYIDKIKDILNVGKITESECRCCAALRHCNYCSTEIEFTMEPTRQEKLKVCNKSYNKVFNDLYELCVLTEFGFDAQEWEGA